MTRARGSFDVQITPDPGNGPADDSALGRMVVDKQFHGDLDGSSHGTMLTGTTGSDGSAGYVLIEKVSGRLHGRAGSFLLQHSGIMNRGSPNLTIEVIPDSGTGELKGLAGWLKIEISDGNHSYEFDYTLGGKS